MKLIHKSDIGVVIKYGTRYFIDIPDTADATLRYVFFDPRNRMSLAHYSRLELVSKTSVLQADYSSEVVANK